MVSPQLTTTATLNPQSTSVRILLNCTSEMLDPTGGSSTWSTTEDLEQEEAEDFQQEEAADLFATHRPPPPVGPPPLEAGGLRHRCQSSLIADGLRLSKPTHLIPTPRPQQFS